MPRASPTRSSIRGAAAGSTIAPHWILWTAGPFKATPRTLPYTLDMVERHPYGSQAFMPMSHDPFLVVVAPDDGGSPGRPRAFMTAPGQGVNLFRGTWHGVLAPLFEPGLFAVIDCIGDGPNVERHWFEQAFVVENGRQEAGS